MFARTQVPSLVPAALAACLAAVAALVPTAPARAGAWLPAPGEHYSELRAGAFSSDSWHDLDGTRHPLVGGGLWESRELTSYSEFGWRKWRSIFVSLPYQSTTRRTGGAEWNRTESGLADLTVGVRLKLYQKESALSLDLGWKAPMGYAHNALAYTAPKGDPTRRPVDVTGAIGDSTRPYVAQYPARLGDGQQDLFATLNFGSPIARLGFVDLAGGYRYRTEAPADQILARAEVGLWVGRRLLIGGRYAGEIATGDGDTPGDKITRHLVGPIVSLRVDEGMDVFAGSFHTASAENALHTDQFYVGLAVRQTKLDRTQGWLGGSPRP